LSSLCTCAQRPSWTVKVPVEALTVTLLFFHSAPTAIRSFLSSIALDLGHSWRNVEWYMYCCWLSSLHVQMETVPFGSFFSFLFRLARIQTSRTRPAACNDTHTLTSGLATALTCYNYTTPTCTLHLLNTPSWSTSKRSMLFFERMVGA